MNKNRMILAIAGGVIGVAALAMAYLAFSAMSAKTAALEGNDDVTGLEEVEGKARTLSAKKPFPSALSVKAIESNAVELVNWQREVFKFVSRGDKVFPATTPAAFKTFLVSDAKRLALLPGAANGSLLPEAFPFGPFREYIVEGKMPADAQLVELQRQWDDIASTIELFGAAGVSQVKDVQLKPPAVEAPAEVTKGKAKAKSKSKSKAKGKEPEPTLKAPVAYGYVFTLTARSAALVKAINLLGTGERFTVVDDFTIQRPNDALQTALGGEAKQKDSAQSGRRSRRARRGSAAAEEKKPAEEEKSRNGIITDPLLDEPMTVTMTVTVYDFRSLEAVNEQEEGANK